MSIQLPHLSKDKILEIIQEKLDVIKSTHQHFNDLYESSFNDMSIEGSEIRQKHFGCVLATEHEIRTITSLINALESMNDCYGRHPFLKCVDTAKVSA